MSYLFAL